MNLHRVFSYIAGCLALFVFVCCHKAGMGGKAEVSVFVKHHGRLIPGALVYVKYNESEFPGGAADDYDVVRACGVTGEANGHTHINNLKHGHYYFYSTAFDSSISERVSGGLPLHIKYAQRKSEIMLEIPVTE